MRKIRVICGGCGIEHINEHGQRIHMLKTRESGPFDCQEEAAARLVSLGVAEYVDGKEEMDRRKGTAKEASVPEREEKEEEQLQEDSMSEARLRAMKMKDLDLLARDRGLDTRGCVKKEDYIALFMGSVRGEEAWEDEEEPPSLDGVDPV